MKNLSKSSLFIGTINKEEVEKTIAEVPWKPLEFTLPPYSIIAPPPTYLFTLGSGVFTSMATISANGIVYNSGIDIFRTDFDSKNQNEPLINIDHIIASPINENEFAIFRDPFINYHWPKPTDEIVQKLPLAWKAFVENTLKNRRPK